LCYVSSDIRDILIKILRIAKKERREKRGCNGVEREEKDEGWGMEVKVGLAMALTGANALQWEFFMELQKP